MKVIPEAAHVTLRILLFVIGTIVVSWQLKSYYTSKALVNAKFCKAAEQLKDEKSRNSDLNERVSRLQEDIDSNAKCMAKLSLYKERLKASEELVSDVREEVNSQLGAERKKCQERMATEEHRHMRQVIALKAALKASEEVNNTRCP